MAKKLYLSAAAHAADNSTKCPGTCSENTHCRAYMDLVEKRMIELGVDVKRGFRDQTGDSALRNRVAEANAWGADLYYAAHTNAGGGRYSMTMCWKDAASKARASVIGKYRTSVSSHKVEVRTDLYEIKATKTPCLYDELFFHDNAEDCARFHNGGMEQMAEETVQALCEILEVEYKAPVAEQCPALTAQEFVDLCKTLVADYTNKHNPTVKISAEDVYVVWLCKTLQNNKALLGAPVADGMYYEVTYNGDKGEVYFDAYKKIENFAVQI